MHADDGPGGDVVRPAKHLHGDDAGLGEPAGHGRGRRAVLRGLPRAHRPRPSRSRRGDRLAADRSRRGRPAADDRRLGARALRQAHDPPPGRRHGPRLGRAVPQRPADPRPGRGGGLLRPVPGVVRARGHRAAAAGPPVRRTAGRVTGHRRGRLPARPRDPPALAVRLAGHPVHRPDAELARGLARLRRRLGAVLVRRRRALHRLRALASPRRSSSASTTPRWPRPAGRRTTSCTRAGSFSEPCTSATARRCLAALLRRLGVAWLHFCDGSARGQLRSASALSTAR